MTDKIEILARTIFGGKAYGALYRITDNYFSLEKPCIILLEMLKIDDVMQVLYNPMVKGVISKQGGLTSHGASVLREVGMPCVTLIHPEDLNNLLGLQIVLDADNSKIYTS